MYSIIEQSQIFAREHTKVILQTAWYRQFLFTAKSLEDWLHHHYHQILIQIRAFLEERRPLQSS
jgi:trimethylamine:corrinoid methyltransferase-like protein